ncbi:Ppx/GppA phosphatase family protein [Verminephrobacter aporrectodeae]|uniref:Ppx/GppA phosphatase family protein n=1 Tax=Verminephrobacter aporrectodeae TaxID=1110389 RepID=UPI002238BC2E|nr:Ppx/GppA phosphatase family protein [Verminephrobacter aporrectodeae]MCW5220075.1 Ppx/GppA family phosphatase [Verminephrobacter aporrectodeae subsp. tuberculatae]MCW5255958.1 Ppx/GppA family phosphatase [Verminephrobacter aporrectodeae subsp. tuberculatae]MCW5289363.1 Ppx/GppA family phosphatase [Verminephrobacter aporrectodeae subsp. tuberculatae]MCW8164519.1 Ppx/GppA family phosphatase [Verminephrobacter aporrectodeae subsp. tuberculatae]MCW8169789.1 Ppx/GppA family phosphatase [Verminep
MHNGTRLAAVDLGSNSFRLEIGSYEFGHIQRVEYLKETVRLGTGLDEERNLTREAMERGWACLARFGERLAGFPRAQVRAVATQTLREASNREDFLARGSQVLGYPIDVVSGLEEARLIYQGVARLLPQSDERRLVVDIGGRSTELILGQQLSSHAVASFRVGSVAWSQRYFANGEFSAQAFLAAEVAAKAVLDEALGTFRPGAWEVAYGSSGTVGAVGDMLAAAGGTGGSITRADLNWLCDRMLRAQNAYRLRMDGLKDERRAVIGGGVSVLRAVFDLLEIDRMRVAQGALRQGALYDLLSREQPGTDLRAGTVDGLMQRFGVDLEHAQRVARTACMLFDQAAPAGSERASCKLDWAARLHEIGCRISHSDSHRHGAYILDNTDAAGFAIPELHRLGVLVQGQRGKVRKLEADLQDPVFVLQLLSLRLAVALCHARRDPDTGGLSLRCEKQRFHLGTRPGWAAAYPQSAHLLREELQAWQKTPWELLLDLP